MTKRGLGSNLILLATVAAFGMLSLAFYALDALLWAPRALCGRREGRD